MHYLSPLLMTALYGDNKFGSIRLFIHSSRLQCISLPLPEKSLDYTLVIMHHSGA